MVRDAGQPLCMAVRSASRIARSARYANSQRFGVFVAEGGFVLNIYLNVAAAKTQMLTWAR